MILKDKSKLFFSIASFMMALCIAIGAFGAHGLKSIVTPELLIVYHTGVEYQFYNTLGLFAISIIINFKENIKILSISAWIIFIGMIIFSFSLYLLVLLKLPILGAITPVGGSLMIVGWLLTSYSILKD